MFMVGIWPNIVNLSIPSKQKEAKNGKNHGKQNFISLHWFDAADEEKEEIEV